MQVWGLSRTWSQTVKRQKPKDLFANGTLLTGQLDENYGGLGIADYGGLRYRGPLGFFHASGHVHWPKITPSEFDYLRNQVHGRLRAKIKDQNVNLAQSFAEYRQVCSMFGNAARDIMTGFRSLRSGSAIKDILRALKKPDNPASKRIANRWLEYQYGLKPLMSDIYGSLEEMSKLLDTGFWIYVRSSTKDEQFSSTYVKFGFPPFWPSYRETHSVYSYRTSARYKISRPGLKQLAQIGITNPLLLAWELVPYSFVVDWMIPVGSYLASLDALNGVSDLQVINGMKSTTLTKVTGSVGNIENKTIWYRREPTSFGLSLPNLRYQPSTSLTAVLNGLALLRQLR